MIQPGPKHFEEDMNDSV